MAKEDFRHSMPLRVRWAEVDPQSIVFNAHYLTYCDICVTEYWRAVGIRYPEDVLHAHGVDIFVGEIVPSIQQCPRPSASQQT